MRKVILTLVLPVLMALAACSPQTVMSIAASRGVSLSPQQAEMIALRYQAQNPQGARHVGQTLAAHRGWGDAQFRCLNTLWGDRESGWRWNADNPRSSAYGIPQALPGRKMASHGKDWATNGYTQILWGLDYIGDRYGSPCGALSASNAKGWY